MRLERIEGWSAVASVGRKEREKRAAERVILHGVGAGSRPGPGEGRGAKNPDGIIEKQKEILYFLLCLASQFPILE